MKSKHRIMFAVMLVLSVANAQEAQQEHGLMSIDDMKADSSTITAIAIYPEAARKNILEACGYPDALLKMDALQKNSSAKVKNILEPYSREVQQKIYDLSRYPGIVAKLGDPSKKNLSSTELKTVASAYPEEIRETITTYGKAHQKVFAELQQLNIENEKEFENLLKNYPEQVRGPLREMVKYPEIMNVLTSDMRSAVVAGDVYKRKPKWFSVLLDSVSAEHARVNAKNMEEWKKGLEKNPEAKKELEASAKEFAEENGYGNNIYSQPQQTVVMTNYVYSPYPYWYGYPYWYDFAFWYPWPLWYDWGFYYGPAGIVYTGFPSPYFMNWYFHYPHHHYNYYHFSDYCVTYYYGHRNSYSGLSVAVSGWMKKAEPEVPHNFFADKNSRAERIREYGKFGVEYNKFSQQHPAEKISKMDFLKTNHAVYPHMSRKLSEPPVMNEQKENVPNEKQIGKYEPKENPRKENTEMKTIEEKNPVKHSEENKPVKENRPVRENQPVKPIYHPETKPQWNPRNNPPVKQPQNFPQQKPVVVPKINPAPNVQPRKKP